MVRSGLLRIAKKIPSLASVLEFITQGDSYLKWGPLSVMATVDCDVMESITPQARPILAWFNDSVRKQDLRLPFWSSCSLCMADRELQQLAGILEAQIGRASCRER